MALLMSEQALAHARLLSPAPRNNNAGIKFGPCGGLTRTNNPTTLQGGSQVMVRWEETINHPGRYILSFSLANDQGFQNNVIDANIPDRAPSAADPLPLRYNYMWTVPNIACETCTLQLIQSMEENPSAPSLYFSCADVRIVQANNPGPSPQPTPPNDGGPGGDQTSLSSTGEKKRPAMASCGIVAAGGSGNGRGPSGPMTVLLLMFPLAVWAALRRQLRLRPSRSR